MRGNTISIIGNCTRDAEVKKTNGGNNAVKWGIAWNSSKKQGDQWIDVPHFFEVECWMTDAQLNNVAPQIVKGAACCVVDGHLEYQSWKNEQGKNRSKIVVRVDDPIHGLKLAPPQQRTSAPAQQYQPQPQGYAPQHQNGAYAQPQPAQNGYAPQPQAYGYGQPQAQPQAYSYGQPPAQPPQPVAQASIYDDDIPF